MTAPADRDATVTAVLGPTNTGKTHFAIERMLAHRSGVIGFPLRLLAREVYDRIVAMRGVRAAALITGEEKIAPAEAQYTLCTVESMPLDWGAEFVAVDEIQLCADPERGHVFTDRLLRARGSMETLFLGAESVKARIAALIPKARFVTRPRFSTLSYTGPKKLSRLPRRSAVVAFSAESVYALAELIRRQKGGAAVVTGALSPRTRNAQVALYQNGDVEHLVATDAIGMGLNLDLDHVAFAGLTKFDGRRHRRLEAQEIGQIAGRAGRHLNDGAFGVTGEAEPLDPETVERIETHRFEPAGRLQWRNARLEFGAVEALLASLEAPPPHPDLTRAREADDVAALRQMWASPDIRAMARGGAAVRLLWDVCQIPDFRKTALADHVALLERVFRFLVADARTIPADWMEAQVARLDRIDGDIDALSKRLAYVRTWTYVSNRGRWLDDPAGWRERTRAVEDRLSDALHERLTQRFVDRRTSVLMRRLKMKERLVAEVSDSGEVTVEGHVVGRLEGFRFRPDPSAGPDELKTLRAASTQALQAQFAHRADKFYNAPDTEIDVTEQGGLMWGTDAVGRLEPGPDQLSPTVRAFVDETAEAAVAERVQRRLSHWIDRKVRALFEPLIALRDDPALTGLARGVAFQLVEALGVMPRRPVAEDVKSLDQEGRAALRRNGVRFGQHHVFLPALLKPAPTRFRLLLWSIHQKFEEFPAPPPPGMVTIARIPQAPEGFYVRAGYRLAGTRALRIDMLERLADLLRPLDARAGFEATPDMLSITGCSLEQFADLMRGLGYHGERGERAKPQRPPRAPAAPSPAAEAAVTGESAAGESGAGQGGAAATEPVAAPEAPAAAASGATVAPVEPAPPGPAPEGPAGEAAAGATPAPVEQPAAEAADVEIFYTFTLAPRRPASRGAGREGGGDAGSRERSRRHGADGPRPGGSRRDGQRPEQPKRDGVRRDPQHREDRRPSAPAAEPARAETGGPRPEPAQGRRGAEPGRRPPEGPKARPKDGARPQRDEGQRVFSAAPREDKRQVDPDSPFAVLKQLRDRM